MVVCRYEAHPDVLCTPNKANIRKFTVEPSNSMLVCVCVFVQIENNLLLVAFYMDSCCSLFILHVDFIMAMMDEYTFIHSTY